MSAKRRSKKRKTAPPPAAKKSANVEIVAFAKAAKPRLFFTDTRKTLLI